VSGPEQRVLAAIDGLPDFLFCAPDEPPADDFALTIMLTRTCGPGAAGETGPNSGERDGPTSASGPGRPTATGGSACCLVPA
jgi:hypothetical protein